MTSDVRWWPRPGSAGWRSLAIKGGVLVLVIVAVAMLWRVVPVASLVQSLQIYVQSLGPAGFMLFALVYVLATLVIGPAGLLSMSAGLIWGPMVGLVAVLASATLAALVAALIGRYVARSRVQALVNKDRRARAVLKAVDEGSWRLVILLRLSPILPYGIQNYLLSVSGIRLLPYTLATPIGILPSSALYVYLGSLGSELASASPLRWVLLGLGLVATALVALLIARKAQAVLAESVEDA